MSFSSHSNLTSNSPHTQNQRTRSPKYNTCTEHTAGCWIITEKARNRPCCTAACRLHAHVGTSKGSWKMARTPPGDWRVAPARGHDTYVHISTSTCRLSMVVLVTKYYICDQSKGCDSFPQGTHLLGYTPSLVYKCNDLWNTNSSVICLSLNLVTTEYTSTVLNFF
jgi:hypothetical protein